MKSNLVFLFPQDIVYSVKKAFVANTRSIISASFLVKIQEQIQSGFTIEM